MEKINRLMFSSIVAYNKYMTKEYYETLELQEILSFVHPNDREYYLKLIRNVKQS